MPQTLRCLGKSWQAGVGRVFLRCGAGMNFQVAILKVLVSYPDGFASLADIKRDMAILATSGPEWSIRTKRLAARIHGLEIFSQSLVERRPDGWRITDAGRSALLLMETNPAAAEVSPTRIAATEAPPAISHSAAPVVAETVRRRVERLGGRRKRNRQR